MSTKINLEIKTEIDLDFLAKGIKVRLIRLFSSVQLKKKEGWTQRYKAIVDTGNPITIIPHFIWSQAYINCLLPQKTTVYGIGTGSVRGKLGETILVLSDENQISPIIRVKTLLLDEDNVPFIIGFEDILTEVVLITDYKSNKAYIQW